MVHELLTDTTPFGSRDGDTTAEQIMSQILSTELPDGIERLPEPYKSVVKKCLVANAKERIRKASELLSYFEGLSAGTAAAQDASTKVYPKGEPPAQTTGRDKDSTKVYPKPSQEQATRVYGDKSTSQDQANSTEKTRGKAVLMVAVAAAVLAAAGGGWWYVREQRAHAALQAAQAKGEAEAQAAADAKDREINGVHLDPRTGLLWMRCSLGQTWRESTCQGKPSGYSFKSATIAAMNFNDKGGLMGFTDWRVPTVRELASLINCKNGFLEAVSLKDGSNVDVPHRCNSVGYPESRIKIDEALFPNSGLRQWTSSSEDNHWKWSVYFDFGMLTTTNYDHPSFSVRLVRLNPIVR